MLPILLAATVILAGDAMAQDPDRPPIPLSQLGTVTQRVGYTDINVRYRRPGARGRALFGNVVEWGRIWTPGADSVTTIAFSRDVLVENQPIAAGRYSLWVVPKTDTPWTVILSRVVDAFHVPYPGPEHDVIRFEISPQRGEHMETLAFYFPEVTRSTAVLRLHWGETVIPIGVRTVDQD